MWVSNIYNLEPDASPVKLSRPQKRRRRLQELAVHKARANDDSGHARVDPGNGMLLKLDGIQRSLDVLIQCVGAASVWSQQDCGNSARTWQTFASGSASPAMAGTEHGGGQEAPSTPLDRVLSHLNPDAPSFVPKLCEDQRHDDEESNSRERRAEQRQEVRQDEPGCGRCGVAGDECFCWQLLCYSCFKSADECSCEDPELKHYTCHECGAVKSIPASAVGFETPVQDLNSCEACGAAFSNSAMHGTFCRRAITHVGVADAVMTRGVCNGVMARAALREMCSM